MIEQQQKTAADARAGSLRRNHRHHVEVHPHAGPVASARTPALGGPGLRHGHQKIRTGQQCHSRHFIRLTAFAAGHDNGLAGLQTIHGDFGHELHETGEIAAPALAAACRAALRAVSRSGLGRILRATRWPSPAAARAALGLLAQASLPMGLIAVGAGLRLQGLHSHRTTLWYGVAVKLLVLPAVAWALAIAFGLNGIYFNIAVLMAALPVSTVSYVMAKRMGGDGDTIAAQVILTTLLAAATLPFWLLLMGL